MNVIADLGENPADDERRASLKSKAARLVYPFICLCFLLSGFAALLYQTAWMRLFSIYFGTSEFAIAIVLAAYMGGLAFGAWIAGRYLNQIRFPILAYGILELAIAISALCVPVLMWLSGLALSVFVGGKPYVPDAGGVSQTLFYTIASIFVLGIPTTCMGATLPILMRHAVRLDKQIGSRTGFLYGINTIGAVIGTIVAAFVLLPAVGLKWTVLLGVAVNTLIYLFAIIIVLAQGFQPTDSMLDVNKRLPFKRKNRFEHLGRAYLLLPLMLASGFISFVYEILWTRLLGHVVGGSLTAFATMLAAFLTGIAIGGLLGGMVARNKKSAILWLIFAEIMIGLLSAYVYYKIDSFIPGERTLRAHAGMAYAVMVPATIFIGATFPLAVRVLSVNSAEAGRQAARVYTWNTCGAVVGALMAGFVIIPWLGFEGTIVLCVIANLAIALLMLINLVPTQPKLIPIAMSLLLVAGAFTWRPGRPDALVNHTFFSMGSFGQVNEEFYGVGRSATVLSLSTFSEVLYRTNGLPEASVRRKGAGPSIGSQQWLGSIPAILRPEANNMLVVGYGGGAALEAIPQHIQSIDVIELEPDIIKANRITAHLRNSDPLLDPRINIVLNDARNALRLSDKKFDIIVSQPSHPWTSGASHLFTKEYMELAKKHLNRDGVFLQWINAEFVNEQLLRDLTATLLSEFKYVRLAQINPQALHFYASDSPLGIEHNMQATGAVIANEPILFAQAGINSVYDILATILLDEQGAQSFAQTGTLIRDDLNQLAVNSRQFGGGLSQKALMQLLSPYDPFVHGKSLKLRDMDRKHSLYVLSTLVRFGMLKRAWDIMQTLDTQDVRTLGRAIIYNANDNFDESEKLAGLALQNLAQDDDAAFLFLKPYLFQSDFENKVVDLDQDGFGEAFANIVMLNSSAQLGEWKTVLDSDELLIQIPVTRVFAPHAFYLRAKARAELSSNEQELEKALALIERSHMLDPSLRKLEIRANLADRLKDEGTLIDTLYLINRNLVLDHARRKGKFSNLSDDSRAELLAQIEVYQGMLGQIRDPYEQGRAEQVHNKLTDLIAVISAQKT